MKIHITKGFATAVDPDWFDYLNQWKWYYNKGYAERKEYRNGKQFHISMHQVIMQGSYIDHINGDKLDNRSVNLRFANKSTNAMNMSKRQGKSYKGVTLDNGCWRTTIWKDNQVAFRTSTPKERWAAMIYDLNATARFGEFARGKQKKPARAIASHRL